MLELKTNLLGEAEFRRQYPRKQPYKTDAWLYERIVRSFSVQKVSATIRHRYPSLNLYDSGMVPEPEITYLTFCKRFEEKDRSEKHHTLLQKYRVLRVLVVLGYRKKNLRQQSQKISLYMISLHMLHQ
jgi:hypothetical protein